MAKPVYNDIPNDLNGLYYTRTFSKLYHMTRSYQRHTHSATSLPHL